MFYSQILLGQKIYVRTSYLWKSLILPPFPSCLISTLLRHVNLHSQQVNLAENEPSTTKNLLPANPWQHTAKNMAGCCRIHLPNTRKPTTQSKQQVLSLLTLFFIFFSTSVGYQNLGHQELALARHPPPAWHATSLAVAAAVAPGSGQEQMYAEEKTTLIPPPPRGCGWNSRGAAPGRLGELDLRLS